MTWDWDVAHDVLPDLLSGLVVTLGVTAVGAVLAAALGLPLALLRRSHRRLVASAATGFVELVRLTPLLVQIYLLFYVAPTYGLTLSPLVAGTLAIGIHFSAFMSEVYRAGIDGVPRGQVEAATALGFSRIDKWRRVILPQVVPQILPASGNYVIIMFKETAILAAITVSEVVTAAREYGNDTYRYLEPLTMAGILFLVISLPAAALVRKVERRVKSYQ